MRFAFFWALDLSKGVLILIAFVAGIKIFLSPAEVPFDVMAWRLLYATLIVVPVVIFGGFVYGYFFYEDIKEIDGKSERDEKE